MPEPLVLRENRSGIEIVTFNRPDKLNALNRGVMDALDRVLHDMLDDSTVRAVILTGAGPKAFVAGADISQFLEFDPAAARQMALRGQAVMDLIERFPKPVIAAINGYALGGGCEIAMACHIRLASTEARFGQPEVKLGIIPGYGGTQRLSRLVGKGRALELILSGRVIGATEAAAMGLVNHVVEPARLIDEALALASEIAAQAPQAIRLAMEAVHHGLNMTIDDSCRLEASLFATLFSTRDQKEGARAFLDKRKPAFTGD